MDREYLERWDRMADEWARRSDQWDRRAEQWDRQEAVRDELMREVHHEMALSREQRERSDAMHEDLREFIREMTTRIERSGRELSQGFAELAAGIADLRAESRAQTRAILTVLDRLGGPEAGTT